jgi:carboxypeptidase PM20D1
MENRTKRTLIASAAGFAAGLDAVRAAKFKPKKKEYPALPEENVNVERYTETLQAAIRCKTISNIDMSKMDKNEFIKLHNLLRKQYPLMHEKLKVEDIGFAALLYTWEGTDPSLKPIALLGHQDVVPITDGTLGDWKHPPFDAVIDDGVLYGRGAIDMKNHLVGVCEAVETLLEEGFTPKRTVYLCFGCNEEIVASPESQAELISKTLESRGVELESLLDEGGGLLNMKIPGVIDKNIVGIGIGEKGNVEFRITVPGDGGHSSAPPKHTAAGKLADVIKDIENHPFPVRVSPEIKNVIKILCENVEFPVRLLTVNYKALMPAIVLAMANIKGASSLMRTMQAVTMLEGSPQFNVLPKNATAGVNFRIIPGEHVSDVEKHLRKVIKNKDAVIEFRGGNEPSIISPTDSRTFNLISDLVGSMSDRNVIVPFIVMGGTDARHYQNICSQLYRISPFQMDFEIVFTSHGTNERIPVSSFHDGVAFFKRYIRKLSSE